MNNYSLLMDLYQLTMAQGYWNNRMHELQANFHHFTRSNPFGNGFTVACGLQNLIEAIDNFRYEQSDLNYLSTLKQSNGEALFQDNFLSYLENFSFHINLWAMPEGTIFFPNEPTIRVTGSIVECQLIETLLLNTMNFQSLIATKAARMYVAAKGKKLIEFGCRRAHGYNGALTASRAAYIGGCDATSNLLAGKTYGIPVQGTHAHSWVLAFDSEEQAFQAYAQTYPFNVVLLVDTFDTTQGIQNAIKLALTMPEPKKQFLGIRLDSGDLTYFSRLARRMLDEAGFQHTQVFASNDLDERLIEHLNFQNAKIDVWGVGSNLVTADGESSLKGVYKLTATQNKDDLWEPKIKISNDQNKINHPGRLQVKRFFHDDGSYIADAIYDLEKGLPASPRIINTDNPMLKKTIAANTPCADLLVCVFKDGKNCYPNIPITDIRKNTLNHIEKVDSATKRLVNPHLYPVGLEHHAFEQKMRLIEKFAGKEIKN